MNGISLTEVAVRFSGDTRAEARLKQQKDMIDDNERWRERWSIMVLLNEKVALQTPMLIRVCLDFVESVTETVFHNVHC